MARVEIGKEFMDAVRTRMQKIADHYGTSDPKLIKRRDPKTVGYVISDNPYHYTDKAHTHSVEFHLEIYVGAREDGKAYYGTDFRYYHKEPGKKEVIYIPSNAKTSKAVLKYLDDFISAFDKKLKGAGFSDFQDGVAV